MNREKFTMRTDIETPKPIDLSRVIFAYGREEKDGLIELRRGLHDWYLPEGEVYSQIAFFVSDTEYVNGMCVYSDDIPEGFDIIVYTRFGNYENLFKRFEYHPSGPFSSLSARDCIQMHYKDESGKQQLSPIVAYDFRKEAQALVELAEKEKERSLHPTILSSRRNYDIDYQYKNNWLGACYQRSKKPDEQLGQERFSDI